MNATQKNFVQVHGRRLAYVEAGSGDPIVFLHGNPTSSFVWRDVIPAVTHLGRCLAPDLLGMGDSDKLPGSGPGSYTFEDHRHYLDGWFNAVGATDHLTLVLHDWGSALGFDWAHRHPAAIRAIAYMEAIVRPISWDDLPDGAAGLFRALRSPAGEQMILRDNFFVENLLPAGVQRPLAPEVLAEYRRPFAQPGEGRRPTLTWPRQIPIDGEPATVADIVAGYGSWMTANTIPKLFIKAHPGASLAGAPREFCRTWPNQRETTVPGIHLLQEDSAPQIAHALAEWITDPNRPPAPRHPTAGGQPPGHRPKGPLTSPDPPHPPSTQHRPPGHTGRQACPLRLGTPSQAPSQRRPLTQPRIINRPRSAHNGSVSPRPAGRVVCRTNATGPLKFSK